MSVVAADTRALGGRFSSALQALNTRYHKIALQVFMALVIAHWAEHLVQAVQVFALGWERPEARGILGMAFPWLVTSESLHYFYAIFMLAGLAMLRGGFVGRARAWWDASLLIQVWHHFEHALLLGQVMVGANLFGQEVPTSVAQLFVQRVELHLLYNALVFIPMVVAMYLHLRPSEEEASQMQCSCAGHSHVHHKPSLEAGSA